MTAWPKVSSGWLLNAVKDDAALKRSLRMGARVCAIYSIAQMLVNGLVVDEVIYPAQIIIGAVRYPAGHPHEVYIQLYSLPNYLAAAVWKVWPSVLGMSAIRNFLFLFCCVFAAFAIALLLTRRSVWGYLAATLTVAEVGLRLWVSYPMWVFPNGYSHGHLGLQVSLLIAILLLAGYWRLGGFLLGLLPGLHAAMTLVVWPWSFLFLIFSANRPVGRDRTRMGIAFCTGLVICLALAAVVFTQARNRAVSPPYDMQADGREIYQNFTATSDQHRHPFPFRARGFLMSLTAFAVFGGLLFQNSRRRDTYGPGDSRRQTLVWLLVFGGLAWVLVIGARLEYALIGRLPDFIALLMPYRLANIPASLLIPFTAALLAYSYDALEEERRALFLVVVALLIFGSGSALLLQKAGYVSSFQGSIQRNLLYVSWGLALAAACFAQRHAPRRLLAALLATAALCGSMFVIVPRLGAVFFFLGSLVLTSALLAVVGWMPPQVRWNFRPESNIAWAALLVFACVLTSGAALPGHKSDPGGTDPERWDILHPYDRELSAWLDQNARPNEMILPALLPRSELQSKIGHPVLMEWETVYLMTYIPQSAATIGMMLRDLDCVDFSDKDLFRPELIAEFALPRAWQSCWQHHSRAEWQSLGQKYGFRLVLSPNTLPLDLPAALPGKLWTLYVIPPGLSTDGRRLK